MNKVTFLFLLVGFISLQAVDGKRNLQTFKDEPSSIKRVERVNPKESHLRAVLRSYGVTDEKSIQRALGWAQED